MFKSIIKAHTEMMLNPFFEPYERPEDENECFEEVEESKFTGNAKFLDILSSKIDEIAVFYDKYF
jgi:hypothetical protein